MDGVFCAVNFIQPPQLTLAAAAAAAVLLQDLLNEIKSERQERAQLGGFAPYQRTIP